MNDSLRKWCRRSLKSFSAGEATAVRLLGREDRIVSAGLSPAEAAIEWAAFGKLLTSRGTDLAKEYPHLWSADPSQLELLNSLIETCPLDALSRPEELGEVHEYLISLRGKPASSATQLPGLTSRKRSGTFYTPQPVVDEILRITLVQKLKDLTPPEVAQLSLLDPAAGSGAFLAAAYRRLLEWHVQWFETNGVAHDEETAVKTQSGLKLSFRTARQILVNTLFGVDFDPAAIEVVRRILWLILIDSSAAQSRPDSHAAGWNWLSSNFKQGNTLIGVPFVRDEATTESHSSSNPLYSDDMATGANAGMIQFDWSREFPQVAARRGFDLIVGNPPYRRERDFKGELDQIQQTSWGRRHQTARMDLWYYFVHRGIELLKVGGTLSFITNAYWMQGSGSHKLISALREQVHVDELFLLRDVPVFPRVSAQHVIFKLTRTNVPQTTVIRIAKQGTSDLANLFVAGSSTVSTFEKPHEQLFAGDRVDASPSRETLMRKLRVFPGLGEAGEIRQGIAENPAVINRRTMQRFEREAADHSWVAGEGVFSLTPDEVVKLPLAPHERKLLRPYHDLCDLDRYRVAPQPSRWLLYSTPRTCPDINVCPTLKAHLKRFRSILEARRETQKGTNSWWHLHWPRDERIWKAGKVCVLQMAIRPSVVPICGPSYVPFSVNVFVPGEQTREHLNYISAVLNSRVLWSWFARFGKRRGIGLDLNGHVLRQAPLPRINFEDPMQTALHDELVKLVDRRILLSVVDVSADSPTEPAIAEQRHEVEAEIERRVQSLFGLDASDLEVIDEILSQER